jgi:hypothetical protein
MRGAERATAIGLKAALLVDGGRFDTFAIKVRSSAAKRIIADTVASVCRAADTFIGPLHVTAPPTYLMTEGREAQLAELVVLYAQKYWNGLLKAMGARRPSQPRATSGGLRRPHGDIAKTVTVCRGGPVAGGALCILCSRFFSGNLTGDRAAHQ